MVDGNTSTTYALADFASQYTNATIVFDESDPLPPGSTITGIKGFLWHRKGGGTTTFATLRLRWLKPDSAPGFYVAEIFSVSASNTTTVINTSSGGENELFGAPESWLSDPSNLRFEVYLNNGANTGSYRFYELAIEVWYETASSFNPIMAVGNI
jgi:hypothetical protein